MAEISENPEPSQERQPGEGTMGAGRGGVERVGGFADRGESSKGRGHWALVIGVLSLVCLMLRGTGLLRLPIFGDEAIYLRWAQLIRGEGLTSHMAGPHQWWISLADPKPPLHYWLMALVFHWSADPLAAARGISVAVGIVGVALLFVLCSESDWLLRRAASAGIEARGILPNGRILGLMAALLMIFCPFIAFYQRLATADALFLSESLAIVWLSLRWGRLAVGSEARAGQSWLCAILLGVAIGAALLTRQGLSYTLCAMPVVAAGLHAWARRERAEPAGSGVRGWPRRAIMTGTQLLLAAVVALAIWSPFLLAELPERALEYRREVGSETQPVISRADLVKEVKRRIFYQGNFTDARTSYGDIARRNLRLAFVPAVDGSGEPTSGWLYYYLTPVVYGVSMLGIPYLLVRRQWRLAILLGTWAALMLGPPLVLGNVIYSRYVLAGVPPLLVGGAYVIAEVIGILFATLKRRPGFAWAGTILLMSSVILIPMRQLGLQGTQWWKQTLTARDRYQYVTGWTSGQATRKVLTELMELAQAGPLIVITDNGWGTPADAIWVYLSESPNVTLYYTDKPRVLTPGNGVGTASLRRDKWRFPPYESIVLPRNVPVLYVTQDYLNGSPAAEYLGKHNPNLGTREAFEGMGDPEGGVSIFQMHTE
jgi:hypothetical protein